MFHLPGGVIRRLALGFAVLAGFGAQSVFAAEPIKIGGSLPLSGGLASNGKAALIAFQMWAEDINAKGGLVGRKVELVYYDDQTNPTAVPGIYTKLLDVDKVDLVISSYGTNLTAPAMPVVMPRGLVFMGLFALAINEEFQYPYYFSMFPAGPDAVHEFSRGFFELAKQIQPRPQTVAIIGADTDFAKKAADGADDNAKQMGFKVVFERSYPPAAVDFTPLVRSIQAAHPDFVYVAAYPPDAVGIVRAVKEVGLKALLIGGGMVGLQYGSLKTQLGEALNGIVNYDFYVPEPTLKFDGISNFLSRYQAKATGAGVDPLGYFVPPFAYADLQVLGDAVTAVGNLDQKQLGEYIRTHTFHTIVGDVGFAANGEWSAPRVLQVQFQSISGNSLDQFKKPGTQVIVYPPSLVSGTLRSPYIPGGH